MLILKIWKMLNLIVWMTLTSKKTLQIMMTMMEELPELFHTTTNTDHHTDHPADTTSTVLVSMVVKQLVSTIMVCVHSRRDHLDHQDLRDLMEMMAHQDHPDHLDHPDLQDHQEIKEVEDLKGHQENQVTQEKTIIITALEMVLREEEDNRVNQVLKDRLDHQDLLDLKVMLACLLMDVPVNLAILVHLGEMEKMDVLDYQEGQDEKDKMVMEIFLRNSTLVSTRCW